MPKFVAPFIGDIDPQVQRGMTIVAESSGAADELSDEDVAVGFERYDQDGDPTSLSREEADTFMRDMGFGSFTRQVALGIGWNDKDLGTTNGKLGLERALEIKDAVWNGASIFGISIRRGR